MNKRLRILFLTPRLPFPLIGGDRLKPYYILKHLAKSHDVTLVSFYQGAEVPKSYIKEIEKMGVTLHVVPLNPFRAGFRTACKLITSKPLEIDYYTQREFKNVVDSLEPEKNFDLGISFFMRTAEYLKNKKMTKILMAEDCRTIYQKRSYMESQNLKQKSVRLWEYKKLQKYEPEIVKHFDVTTLVSRDDIKAMQEQNPGAEYRLLTNGTDLDKFEMPADNSKRKGILFAGKIDVWANELMILNIVKEILPIIKEKVPDVEFHIAGAKPTAGILALKCKNVILHADVPEMVPYLQQAELFLHPHRGGSGIQNKLLEAMASGCPVVTTPTGNQGIGAKHDESALIGQTKEELARHAVRLLTDKDFAAKIAKNARALMEDTHSWNAVYKQMDDILEELFD